MRRKPKSICKVDNLEVRRLLSTIYVDAIAPGPTQDGTSWATAYTSLQSALAVAISGTTIEVGQGIYKPTSGTVRAISFQLKSGVTIYGGYAGYGESNPDARDTALYPAILSGDIGAIGDMTDNSYHVVVGYTTGTSPILDGFTITAGNADTNYPPFGGGIYIQNTSSAPITNCVIEGNSAEDGGGICGGTVSNCVIEDNSAGNYGGGAYEATLNNCSIKGNIAGNYGGGTYGTTANNCVIESNNATFGGGIYGGTTTESSIQGNSAVVYGGGAYSPLSLLNCIVASNTATSGGGVYVGATGGNMVALVGCVFIGNNARSDGGAIAVQQGSPWIANVTVADNSAGAYGGALYFALSGQLELANSILWGDAAPNGTEIYTNASNDLFVSFSDVEGGYGSHNLNSDPQFVQNPDGNNYGDLHLLPSSPCLNLGFNSRITQLTRTTTDIDGNPRFISGIVDMGAYECQTVFPLYVDTGAAGSKNGTNWANAFTSLQTALQDVTAGATLLVAKGTYKPTTGTDRTATFQLKSGVAIYGGFAGNGGPDPDDRNVEAYSSVLTGDIGKAGVSTDNSYHVVTGSGTDATAILDGFTITGGNANGSTYPQNAGGGLLDLSGAPSISNCTFIRNTSTSGGGGGLFFANNSSSASPTFINCSFFGNSSTGSGGAMSISSSYYSSTIEIVDCVFDGNSSATDCGGLYISVYNSSFSPILANCTFTENTAGSGGGIYIYFMIPSLGLVNTILWANAATTGNQLYNWGGGSISVTNTDIQGGYSGIGIRNITTDPQFIRTSSPGPDGKWGTADDDYGDLHLQFTSPAIDAGSNAAIPSGITTDLDGNPRIFDFPGVNNGAGAVVDMGAYELGFNLDEIIVPAGQELALPSGGYTFTANSLSIGAGGTLDIGNDILQIQYAFGSDPVSTISSLLASGYANGAWNGAGIISSAIATDTPGVTSVGYYDSGSTVSIRRTWVGDANLDGVINADDLSLMLLGQAEHQTRWQDGNFNFDNQINADDWSKFTYVNAYANNQVIPAAAPAFAQGVIGSASELDDLIDTPEA